MIVVVSAIGISQPCSAHSIKVFAMVEGDVISGYAYSRGGDRIRNQPIVIQDADGVVFGETTTDDNGEFTFPATQRIDHVIILETADGHRASFSVSADEFPETLAPSGTPSEEVAAEPTVENPQSKPSVTAETPKQESEPGGQSIAGDEIGQIVETAVNRQIRPLREQLEAYESKTRLHDTLGGIGYIIGIAGIAFYFMGKQR
jgi:nickel transport protein